MVPHQRGVPMRKATMGPGMMIREKARLTSWWFYRSWHKERDCKL